MWGMDDYDKHFNDIDMECNDKSIIYNITEILIEK